MNFSRMLMAITPISMDISIQKMLLVAPDKAVCTVNMVQKYIMPDRLGQFGPRGGEHQMVFLGTMDDTWTKSGNTWLMANYGDKRTNPVITMDGKPFPPKMPHKPSPRRP